MSYQSLLRSAVFTTGVGGLGSIEDWVLGELDGSGWCRGVM